MAPKNTKPAGANGGYRKLIASNWKPHSKGTLQGFFSVTLSSGLVLHRLRLHERDNSRWINFPAREYIDAAGAKQYARFVGFVDRQSSDRFRDAVLEALDELLEEMHV